MGMLSLGIVVNLFSYFLSFPNPDCESLKFPSSIKPRDMIDLLQSTFYSLGDGTEFDVIDNALTMKAFEEAFYQLEDYKSKNRKFFS